MESYQIFFTFSLVLLVFIQQRNCGIHKYITSNELGAGLNPIEIIEPIPDYQTVRLTHEKTQDSTGHYTKLSFDAFGKRRNIDLRLHEPTLIGDRTPIWLMKHSWLQDVFFEQLNINTLGNEITLWETSEGTIIGSGTNENGVPYFVGSVEDFTITPVTSRDLNTIRRSKRDNSQNELFPDDEDQFRDNNETDYHFIQKKQQSSDDDKFQSAIIKTETLDDKFVPQFNIINSSEWRQDDLDNNTIIYPEILLFTDFALPFIQPGSSEFNELIVYLVAFWNNVALHFKTLSNPSVSLRIIGIVICTSRKAIPFLNDHVSPDGRIYVSSAMVDTNKWLRTYQHTFPMNSYDMAVVMTNRHLCRLHKESGYCGKRDVLGLARSNAKCASNDYPFSMTAIIHDDLNFRGVPVASHELAHLMGAHHDGSKKLSALNCDPNDVSPRYIMLPKSKFVMQNFVWSNCSRLHISAAWRKNPKYCLTTNSTIDTGKMVSIILPGDIMSLDQQCVDRGYSHACETMHDICKNLQCYSGGSTNIHCHKSGPALDGSNCGPNYHCILGECTQRNQYDINI